MPLVRGTILRGPGRPPEHVTMGYRTLLEVCGNPSGPLPSRGTPAWKGIDNALSKALKEVGAKGRFYSWAALWRTLHGSSPSAL